MFNSLFCVPLTTSHLNFPSYLLFAKCRPIWKIVNATTWQIIQQLQQHSNPRLVVAWLQQQYNIPNNIAQADVAETIQEIQKAGLDDSSVPPATPVVQSLFIHVTNACNLQCQHCYATHLNSQQTTIPYSIFANILSDFREVGGKKITLSGGEPLIHPDIHKILSECSTFSRVQILTNGTLLTNSLVQQFIGKPIQIQISLDGSCAQIHDAIRGKGSFEKALQGIHQLQTAGLNSAITLCTTVLPTNFPDLSNIICLAESLHIPKLRFLQLQNLGQAQNLSQLQNLAPTQNEWLVWQEHLGSYPQSILQNLDHTPQLNIEYGISGTMFEINAYNARWCSIGNMLVINSNLDVYPCPWLMQAEWKLGNLQETSFSNIIQSARLQEICEIVRDRPLRIPECTTCSWRNLCQSGCLAYAYNTHKTPWARDCFCEYRRKFYQTAFNKLAESNL